MRIPPEQKRVIAYVDGQNLFHTVKQAFNYPYPNYNIRLLSEAICKEQGWTLVKSKFYTGLHSEKINQKWFKFWTTKGALMGKQGVEVHLIPMKYSNEIIAGQKIIRGREKGVDVRLALDIVESARLKQLDVALIFSQDQDLSEVVPKIQAIAKEQDRWIKIACAFPEGAANQRGIERTDWIKFSKDLYDSCLDRYNYSSILSS